MAFFKWVFHKNIDVNELKGEIKQLYAFFQEYTIFFNQKSKIFEGIYHAGKNGKERLRIFLPRLKSLTQDLLNELKKERKLMNLLEDKNVLTKKETDEVKIIKQTVTKLRDNLNGQLDSFKEIKHMIKGEKWGFDEHIKIKPFVDRLEKLIEKEREMLFSEEEEYLDKLISDIVKEKEFLPIGKVFSPAVNAVVLASNRISMVTPSRLSVGAVSLIPTTIAEEKQGVAYYPGSFDDPIIIFCFPNVKYYVLQDIQKAGRKLRINLELLQRFGIIQNLSRKGRNSYTFIFNAEKKDLVAYYGLKGDCSKFIPPIIRSKGIKILMTKAFTISLEERKKILNKFSPHLLPGAFVHEGIATEKILIKKGLRKIAENWWIKE